MNTHILLIYEFYFGLLVCQRRFLKPYMNPMQLLKRYDQPDPNSAEQRMKYTFLVKTGQGPTAGTNANVTIFSIEK